MFVMPDQNNQPHELFANESLFSERTSLFSVSFADKSQCPVGSGKWFSTNPFHVVEGSLSVLEQLKQLIECQGYHSPERLSFVDVPGVNFMAAATSLGAQGQGYQLFLFF